MMAMYESFDAARARGDFAVLPELVRSCDRGRLGPAGRTLCHQGSGAGR